MRPISLCLVICAPPNPSSCSLRPLACLSACQLCITLVYSSFVNMTSFKKKEYVLAVEGYQPMRPLAHGVVFMCYAQPVASNPNLNNFQHTADPQKMCGAASHQQHIPPPAFLFGSNLTLPPPLPPPHPAPGPFTPDRRSFKSYLPAMMFW